MLLAPMGYTVMRPMDITELARQADTIVLGTVTHQESAWDAQHTSIHTDVTVAVERAIVGTPGSEVTFRVRGGVIDGMGMRTSNDPVFRDGERVLLFLDTTSEPARVVGLEQGKVTVQDNTVLNAGELLPLDDVIAAIHAAVR